MFPTHHKLDDIFVASSLSLQYFVGYDVLISMFMKKISRARNQSQTRLLSASCCFLAWVTLRPRRLKRNVPPKRPLTFNEVYIVILFSSYFLFTTSLIFAAIFIFTISILHQGKTMIINATYLLLGFL